MGIMNSGFTIHHSQWRKALLLCFIMHFALCVGSLHAQNAGYKDRNEGDTVVIKKSTYIIHKTKKGETLFTIAAHYHVSVNDMEKANKEVSGDIKKNTVILVPVHIAAEE